VCAGAYASGAVGSNECPAGSARIEDEDPCRTASAAVGKTVLSGFVVTLSSSPRGCFSGTLTGSNSSNSSSSSSSSNSSSFVFFNNHSVGAGSPGSLQLCAITTGAPHAVNRHACVPLSACTGRAACTMRIKMAYIMTHTPMYTYHPDGARRRCRTAAQAVPGGGRACRGTARKGPQLAHSRGTVGVGATEGSGAAVLQQRSAHRQCAGGWARLLTWVLTVALTCAAAEHVRVCSFAVRTALRG
jgi:hypothetical protein